VKVAEPRPERVADAPRKRKHNRLRWLKWAAGIALLALLVAEGIYLWPRLHESWQALTEIHWGWVAGCIVTQALSLSAFGRVQKQLMSAAGVRVRQAKSVAVRMLPVLMRTKSEERPCIIVLNRGHQRKGPSTPKA